jgi:hypothetical protein
MIYVLTALTLAFLAFSIYRDTQAGTVGLADELDLFLEGLLAGVSLA